MNKDQPVPLYPWQDHENNRGADVTDEHRLLAELAGKDNIYGPYMIAACARGIQAAALLNTQPIAKVMEQHAIAVAEATGNQMPADIEMEIHFNPRGLTTVRFTARTGDSMGKGPLASRIAFGATPEMAAAELIEELNRCRVSDKIRVHFLRARAAELGYKVVKADGSKGED